MSVPPNLIYRVTAILDNTLGSYFMNIHKVILVFIGRGKRQKTVNNIEIFQQQDFLQSYSNQDSVVLAKE